MSHSHALSEMVSDKKVYFEGGGLIDFSGKSIEEIKNHEANENREMINVKNYELFKELTVRRINNVISINKCDASSGYIIGDNPVFNHANIFDPNGFISLPLNHNHYLTLLPLDNGATKDLTIIHKIDMNKGHSEQHSTLNNLFQLDNAQRFVMGKIRSD